jgi:tryptophan 7-halogenase
MGMVSQILVVGADCAGLLAALNLKAKMPEMRIRALRHPIGEESQPAGLATAVDFPTHIHEELGMPPLEFLKQVRPMWRIGTRYQWGPRAFFDHTTAFQIDTRYALLSRETGYYLGEGANEFEAVGPASANISAGKIFLRDKEGRPQIARNRYGYHLEYARLRDFLERAAHRAGVNIRDGQIVEVLRGEMGVEGVRLESGQTLTADLYIDASGAQSILLGQALGAPHLSFASSLLCDSAIVATWPRTTEPVLPNTAVRAMAGGWCWQTEHESFIGCGHAFSSAHISADEAEKSLRTLYPKATDVRLVKLKQGRHESCWVNNVVAIGSAAGFVEPLAAAGSAVAAFQCYFLAQSLVDCDGVVRPTIVKQFNKHWRRLLEGEREFLGLFYKYNTTDDTGFWRDARALAYLGSLEEIVRCYQDVGPDSIHRNLLLAENDPIGLEGYFSVLIGQKVPHRPWTPPAAELQSWETIQDSCRRRAASAFTVADALAYFASPAAMAETGAMA